VLVLGWVVQCKCLQLFWICYLSIDPFVHRHVAIDFVVVLSRFVVCLLVDVFGLCLFLRI
jgi:hypothetical protein